MQTSMHFSIAELQEIGRSVREEYMQVSDVEMEWPDCYDISIAIRRHLIEGYGVNEDALQVEEYVIDHPTLGTEIHHYALSLNRNLVGEPAIIDASFDQFAEETSTAIGLVGEDKIEPVVVVAPRDEYVFEH